MQDPALPDPKLSWNQFTRPPHDSFRWRGIDGSEVLAHLPPVGTYNADLEPDQLRHSVAAFRDHDRSDASLILFGHGDGGGGPTPEMLESAARWPRLIYVSVSGFGNTAETPYAGWPAYAGVAEAMSGIYEFSRHEGELPKISPVGALGDIGSAITATVGMLAALRHRASRGARRVVAQLLRNQFHDILPGTSLARHASPGRAALGAGPRSGSATGRGGARRRRARDGAPSTSVRAPRRIAAPSGGVAMYACPALGSAPRSSPRRGPSRDGRRSRPARQRRPVR